MRDLMAKEAYSTVTITSHDVTVTWQKRSKAHPAPWRVQPQARHKTRLQQRQQRHLPQSPHHLFHPPQALKPRSLRAPDAHRDRCSCCCYCGGGGSVSCCACCQSVGLGVLASCSHGFRAPTCDVEW